MTSLTYIVNDENWNGLKDPSQFLKAIEEIRTGG
jgi:hypothetical protein